MACETGGLGKEYGSFLLGKKEGLGLGTKGLWGWREGCCPSYQGKQEGEQG